MTTKIEPCHDCGDQAVAVQASSCDPETGYVDAMALCGPCYAARTGEVDLTPLLDALAKEHEPGMSLKWLAGTTLLDPKGD